MAILVSSDYAVDGSNDVFIIRKWNINVHMIGITY